MPNYAIEIEGLWKQYRLGERQSYVALRDILANPLSAFKTKPKEEFWALKDINLKVKEGEVLGVIGKNGSGKSTLLKILTRITPPTKGQIKLHGRVASLLEVGTGFNPELTGRENIFLNGSILGMTRSEIRRKFDEIVDFSGVEKFLDTPVKRYSSGMYVRLAFAVAAHLESEILLVDEVLAVGDMEFQKKCLGKMKDVTQTGKTVLFVSHNMSAIESLCNNSALLESGGLLCAGSTHKIINRYLNINSPASGKISFSKSAKDTKAIIHYVELLDENNTPISATTTRMGFKLNIGYEILETIHKASLDITIYRNNVPIIVTSDTDTKSDFTKRRKGHFITSVVFEENLLRQGMYTCTVALKYPGVEFYSLRENIILEVKDDRKDVKFNDLGCVDVLPTYYTSEDQEDSTT